MLCESKTVYLLNYTGATTKYPDQLDPLLMTKLQNCSFLAS